ncbi:MAG TPA: hypothetical protein VD969_05735 [Symbiobacteriaceae bacterium]|nr:hypothetical protein [Symbiobacteriaceae bacterium]
MEPTIYMPTEAAMATAPDGRKLVFFTVPQLEVFIKNVIAARPNQYTYSWGYHPGHKVHVLLCTWPEEYSVGLAIPEGPGDAVLSYMQGTTAVYITSEPVQEALSGNVSAERIEQIVLGNTVGLTEVKFKPEA